MDNTKKFENKADAYTFGRPSYPSPLIDMLYNEYGFRASSVIADIGSGTGIFTRQLLDMGSTVFAIEPNESMRKKAEAELCKIERFHSVNATAENTTLDNCSVDHIAVAQAFHWFDAVLFKKECQRILKSFGNIVLIWNTRDVNAEINKIQSNVFEDYCKDFHGFSGGIKRDDERINLLFGGKYNLFSFDNPLVYDRERYIKRCLSSSYSLTEKDDNFKEYLMELNDIFDRFSKNGILVIPNNTIAYVGEIT